MLVFSEGERAAEKQEISDLSLDRCGSSLNLHYSSKPVTELKQFPIENPDSVVARSSIEFDSET